jgi:predicted kinase
VQTIVIVTGPPGAGKSTVGRLYAESHARAVHFHTDDFWSYIVAGFIPPFEAESEQQNQTVMQAIAVAAFTYANAGYLTVVDGIVGPWMLGYFLAQMKLHPNVELHYAVLRPRRDVALARAQAREAKSALIGEKSIMQMWEQFADLKQLEANVLDTSDEDPATTARRLSAAIVSGSLCD